LGGCGVFFVDDVEHDLGVGDKAAVDQARVDVHDGHAEGDGAGHGGDAAEEFFEALLAMRYSPVRPIRCWWKLF
jgi:hypothetical protein